jgi:hypothetical protein
MPDVRVARPLLEDAMNMTQPRALAVEPMIDAASRPLRISPPYYWSPSRDARISKRIPHYRIGQSGSLRLSELTAWAARKEAHMSDYRDRRRDRRSRRCLTSTTPHRQFEPAHPQTASAKRCAPTCWPA